MLLCRLFSESNSLSVKCLSQYWSGASLFISLPCVQECWGETRHRRASELLSVHNFCCNLVQFSAWGSVGWGWGVLVLNPISAVRTWAENKLGQTPPPRPSESQFGSMEHGTLVIGLVYFFMSGNQCNYTWNRRVRNKGLAVLSYVSVL